MDNANEPSYYDKVDGLARWFGMSVVAAFFASLERCSCVNLTTFDTDDDDMEEEAKDRPLMLTTFSSFASTSSFASATSSATTNHNNANPSPSVENLPV